MTSEHVNVQLDTELLHACGYLVASAAFFLSQYSQTPMFLLSLKGWEQRFPYFDWKCLKDAFPALIEQGFLESAKAGKNDHWLLCRSSPGALGWEPNASVTMNLKQHGLTFPEIQKHLRAFTLSHRYGPNGPGTDLDKLFTQYALAEHYIDRTTFKPVVITTDWKPQQDTVDALVARQITKEFIDAKVFEFALYWSEVGFPRRSYDNTFKAFVTSCWGVNEGKSL